MSAQESDPKFRVCVFTGTRADYGLLRPLIGRLGGDDAVEAQLLVTGSHLSTAHGETWKEIAADGFRIDERVEILLDADTEEAVCTAMGLGIMRFGEALRRLRPNCLVILGDRYEALAAAAAATVFKVPVAHIHGGEITVGAIDNAFRNAITKLSHVHFVSTAGARQRVIDLGEVPGAVFQVGALGVENALSLTLLDRNRTLERLGLPADSKFLLITFHPATLERQSPIEQLRAVLEALMHFDEWILVFTGANADVGGRAVNSFLAEAAAQRPDQIKVFPSLGATVYLSAAKHAGAVIGNSSSGVIEVPSLGVPVVDIGTRQYGRERASSVIWAAPNAADIKSAVRQALSTEFKITVGSSANPYSGGKTSERIVEVLTRIDFGSSMHKEAFG